MPQTQLQCEEWCGCNIWTTNLFVGVRNKYCAVCYVSERQEKEPLEHRCYRNWSGSSAGMESDIVLRAFDSLSKPTA